jgi:hypothetical protein
MGDERGDAKAARTHEQATEGGDDVAEKRYARVNVAPDAFDRGANIGEEIDERIAAPRRCRFEFAEMRLFEQDLVFRAQPLDVRCDTTLGERLPRAIEQPGARRVYAADAAEVEDGALSFCARGNQLIGAALDRVRSLDRPVAVEAKTYRVRGSFARKARRGRDGCSAQKLIPMPRLPPLSKPIGGFL